MTAQKPQAQPMKEPMKPHGDKIHPGDAQDGAKKPKPTGGAGEPQTTPLEPERQGGIGGP